MLGKASEIKVKQLYGRCELNPDYKQGSAIRYIDIPLDQDINDFIASIGDADVLSIQYQMSVSENVADSVLIIYKE